MGQMRRLIVCCDGTWQTPDNRDDGVAAPSNVTKIARAIPPQAPDDTPQIVYYDSGVGSKGGFLSRIVNGALGGGLEDNVRDAYLFLVHNYTEGDQIFFFGFSRGAYTVRSAAGMIRKVGLLHKTRADRDEEGWRVYRLVQGGADSDVAKRFREADNSRWPVSIRFIGVWDTVGARGIPGPMNLLTAGRYRFHDVTLSSRVEYAYQALAIDERRRFFRPAIWEQRQEGIHAGQKLEQMWFPGVHMDVGGGYKDSSLADCALDWMVEKARGAGLVIDDDYLGEISHPNDLGPQHESWTSFYKTIPAVSRPIGLGSNGQRPNEDGESVSQAAINRHDGYSPPYRPNNLIEYVSRRRSTAW
jgi:uncharacterized protein (DUF2235 family)